MGVVAETEQVGRRMPTREILVSGMTCGHCVDAVTAEVLRRPGVQEVVIALEPGGLSKVSVTADPMPSDPELDASVSAAGYSVSRP